MLLDASDKADLKMKLLSNENSITKKKIGGCLVDLLN